MQVCPKPFHREAFAQGLGDVVRSAAGVQAFLLRLKILDTGVILLQFIFINMSVVGLEVRHSRCLLSLSTWCVSQISHRNLTLQWDPCTAMYIYVAITCFKRFNEMFRLSYQNMKLLEIEDLCL